ncbi:tetratricopeptide repeat protein [Oculatella sp. FACHB-28]|uniref:tetratricopeptide repeat protein n=1 Tax=Oculatella sp. FACHB-28 TaxID=2692845 RepID=UPI00168790A7|nr:tetratricopeptide repeat protein [Oculatella sp. FACHB-28]MBD2056794.1 tetratricopeptide repeat protein [Oculatella sp. FACHB-28]
MKMAFSSFTVPALESPIAEIKSTLFKAGTVATAVMVVVTLICVGIWVTPLQIPSLSQLHLPVGNGLPATYHQAMQLRQQGDLIGALNYLEHAAIASPQAVPVLYELGQAEFQLSQVEDAIAHYREALAQDPDHAASAYRLGSILVTLGSVDEGIEYLQHSVAVAPTALTYYDLGISLGRRGDRQGEIENLKQAIALQPDYADAHLNLGITYARLNDVPHAKQSLQIARDLYQEEIEKLEHAHLGQNSLDARIIDQMIAALDSGCGVQCWQQGVHGA